MYAFKVRPNRGCTCIVSIPKQWRYKDVNPSLPPRARSWSLSLLCQINLDFNQGQGRFQLIQWCILVVKRITQSKQRIKQSKGSSIFSSSHSSKIEEVMEITFTTIFFLITSFKIEEVSKAKLTNQNLHGSHNIQYPRIKYFKRSIRKKKEKNAH